MEKRESLQEERFTDQERAFLYFALLIVLTPLFKLKGQPSDHKALWNLDLMWLTLS
jgi:hypothetical protein